jgi:hypothetical protein
MATVFDFSLYAKRYIAMLAAINSEMSPFDVFLSFSKMFLARDAGVQSSVLVDGSFINATDEAYFNASFSKQYLRLLRIGRDGVGNIEMEAYHRLSTTENDSLARIIIRLDDFDIVRARLECHQTDMKRLPLLLMQLDGLQTLLRFKKINNADF